MAMLNIQKVKSILNWWLNHYTMVIQTIKHGGRCTFSWFMHWESCSIQEWRENLILLDELPFMVFEMFFFPGEIIHNFHGVIQQSIVQRGQHHLFSQQMTAGKRPKSQVLVDLSGWAHEKKIVKLLGALEHGCIIFPIFVGMMIQSDFHSIIFQGGGSTTRESD